MSRADRLTLFRGLRRRARVAHRHHRIPALIERNPAFWPRCRAAVGQRAMI